MTIQERIILFVADVIGNALDITYRIDSESRKKRRATQILSDENQAKWESGELGRDPDSAVRVTVDGEWVPHNEGGGVVK